MPLPNYQHEYSEAAELDWALDRFHQALKARMFDGVRRGKRGWQNFPEALERAKIQIEDAEHAKRPNDKSRELLDAAAFLFMAWWRT